MRKLGVRTFPIPLGLKRNAADPVESKCIRCDTCDGYPCLVHAKSDADINCIREIMHLPNVTLMTNSRVLRLLTNAMGTAVTAVEVQHSDSVATARYEAAIFALCAGAVNSAVVLLQSANDKHPRGLANGSDQVGRNFMYHQADALLALSTIDNEDSYMKTWGTNDFYLRDTDPDYPWPLGQVQPVGSFHHEMMKGDAPPLTPGFVLEQMKKHAVPWWLTTEDLPDPDNRVTLRNTTPSQLESTQPGPAGALNVSPVAGGVETSGLDGRKLARSARSSSVVAGVIGEARISSCSCKTFDLILRLSNRHRSRFHLRS